MEIFWMDTKEGPQIPLLMVKSPLSIDNINSAGLYPSPDFNDFSTRNYASPELTKEWFDATDEELYQFMSEYSIGYSIYKNGRDLTLPSDIAGEEVRLGISPQGYSEYYETVNGEYKAERWVPNTTSANIPPWNNSFYSSKALFYTIRGNSVSRYYGVDITGSRSFFRLTQGLDGTVNVPVYVLIRDNTGRVKQVLFQILNKMRPTDADRPYFGKIITYAVGGYDRGVIGSLPDSFWQTQTGGEPTPPKGGGIVDVTNRFSPRLAASGVGIYPISREQLTAFSKDLWTEGFTEKFIYNILGDPMESIIALRWYYGLNGSIKRLPADAYLTLGNVAFNGGLGSESNIITKPAESEMLTFTCGEIQINRYFNNFLDYSPFTQIQVYIPWYGFLDIDATEVMGKIIRLDYNINIVTGAAIAYIYVNTGPNEYRILMQIPCTVGMDIPLNINTQESILSRMITAGAGVAGIGLGAAATFAAPAIAAPAAAAAVGSTTVANTGQNNVGTQMVQDQINHVTNSVMAPMMTSGGGTKRSGGMDSETASLGYFQPFILTTRPVPVAPDDYDELIGSPDFRSGMIRDFQGYIRIGAIKGDDEAYPTTIPRQAMNEIEQLLRAGVYSE